MKDISVDLQQVIDGETTTLTTLLLVRRSDGVVLGFTSHDRDITYDMGLGDGAIVFRSSLGYSRTAVKSSADLSVDNATLDGLTAEIDDDAITEADLRAGRYTGAEVRFAIVNWSDLSQGHIALQGDSIGEVAWQAGGYRAEVRGLMHRLQQPIGEVATAACRADLGDERCRVPLEPPAWTPETEVFATRSREAHVGTTVRPTTGGDRHFRAEQVGITGEIEPDWPTTVGDTVADGTTVWRAVEARSVGVTVDTVEAGRRIFRIVEPLDVPEDWFDRGRVRFLSGDLIGLTCEIRRWDHDTREVELAFDTPPAIDPGDQVLLIAGCAKDKTACKRFDNIWNNQSEADLPGMDAVISVQVPDAGGSSSGKGLF